MVKISPILQEVTDTIKAIDTFKNVYLGKPKGVERSQNTPFALIILEQISHKGINITLTVQVVIVFDTKNDTAELYDDFLATDYKVKESLMSLPYDVSIEDTFLDEDRLVSLKAGVIRFKINNLVEFR